jgi:putative phage-type endonuclease
MKRERLSFEDKQEWLKARTQDVTSTAVSALFGGNPWQTTYELWQEKKSGEIVEIPQTDRMKWGTRLESAIATGVAEDEGWNVRAWNTYERVPELRIGASFDYRILGEPKAVLEIKCVDSWIFRQTWVEHPNGDVEPPPYMEFQLQHEMLVSGYEQAYLYALVGGNNPVKIYREADPKFQKAIIAKVSQFWESIATNQEPAPDYTRDGPALRKRYSYVDSDSVLNTIGDSEMRELCAADIRLAAELKQKKEDREATRARVLHRLGHHEVALVDGHTCTAKTTKAGKRNLLIRAQEEGNG